MYKFKPINWKIIIVEYIIMLNNHLVPSWGPSFLPCGSLLVFFLELLEHFIDIIVSASSHARKGRSKFP